MADRTERIRKDGAPDKRYILRSHIGNSKKCVKCLEIKSLSEFYELKKRNGTFETRCKLCKNLYNKERRKKGLCRKRDYSKIKQSFLKRKYGINLDQYFILLQEQNFKCLICETILHHKNSGRMLSLDHCHETGRIRGFLCAKCNKGLGLFNDNSNLLLKAHRYLKVQNGG